MYTRATNARVLVLAVQNKVVLVHCIYYRPKYA